MDPRKPGREGDVIPDSVQTLRTARSARYARSARNVRGPGRPRLRIETLVTPVTTADRALSAEGQRDLAHAFERFEAQETGPGVHERMIELLQELRAGAG